ncbi:class A beta-lactamase [Brevibacterium renqingii]|uniref:class A beta-lactamase n=1 Tax=Brevibacterium renqingii TaxID=2776916 RepID=UPI001ADF2077|nr:class A beta-lactamase [Brevibacterium renqingii]
MTRPSLQILAATALTAFALSGCSPSADPTEVGNAEPTEDRTQQAEVTAKLESLEKDFHARVGVSALDTSDGTTVGHRADERFGFASSLKVFAVAELLDRTTPEELDKRVTWSQADVDQAGWTPVTEKHVDDGLPLEKIAEAALRVSDNAAMNIVLDEIGGPEGLDAALEDHGDATTEVVNEEPDLNDVKSGSADNTTTPEAFTSDLEGLIDPERLSTDDRDLLLEWMSDNETGDPLIRAGAPEGWTVKDKSGHSDGIQNDIAVVSPPGEDPIVVSVLTETDDPDSEEGPALVEAVAEVILHSFE